MAAVGYWGDPSSTIDWCEDNYVVEHHIAEFSNSITSFFIVLAGLFPIVLHLRLWRCMEPRDYLVCLSIIVVGLGSVAFHGTLQFRHQMWDEVPMLWTVVIILYSLLEHHQKEPKYGVLLPACLACYAAAGTYATSQQGGNAQWFSFHTFFGGAEFPCLYLVYKFFSGLDEKEARLCLLLKRGFAAYAVAVALWLTDLNFCSMLQKLPQYTHWNLHAFGWHLFISCGLYSMTVGMWYHRKKCVLKEQVKIDSILFFIPVVIPLEKAA